jgi:hypothetical protein
MEMRVSLAKLIWHYDIQLVDEGEEVPAFDHRNVSAGRLELRAKQAKEKTVA